MFDHFDRLLFSPFETALHGVIDAASRGAANRVHFKKPHQQQKCMECCECSVSKKMLRNRKQNAFTLGYLERSPSYLGAHTTHPKTEYSGGPLSAAYSPEGVKGLR